MGQTYITCIHSNILNRTTLPSHYDEKIEIIKEYLHNLHMFAVFYHHPKCTVIHMHGQTQG